MADPFSITTGTVGIISLGIQLCKEITTYVDSWQGYDADLESIGWKAESLKIPLKQLRDFIEDTRVTDPNTAKDITEKVSELERHLRRLEKRLTQAKPMISASATDKVKNTLKKAAYPIRARDALRELKDDLDSVQSTIEFALTIFNAQQAQKTFRSQEKTLKLAQEIYLTVSTMSQNITPPPSVLKSLCDRCEEHANLADLNAQSNPTTQGDDFDLDIDARLSSMTLSTKRARREDSTKRLFRYYSGWLARQITLSFSLSYAAGAFSIAPVLEVRVYRGPGSWVDNAVPYERLKKITEIQDHDSLQELENGLISDFQRAISTGEFGPGDLQENGMSVVEYIVFYVNGSVRINTRNKQGHRLSKFLRFMIECGYNLKLDNPAWLMSEALNAKWGANDEMFVVYLINHGAIVKNLPATRRKKENIRRLLRRDTELVDLPEIVKIILLDSELELREALQSKSTNLINGRIAGRLLLELAVGWPGGVHVLLEFGAEASKVILRKCSYGTDETDDSDCDDYCDSIMPLLQGGCSFDAHDICSCKSKKARLLLINEFVNRRKSLLDMARRCLPPGRLAEILWDFNSESILDVHVPQICTEIINNGGPVHRSMQYELKDYQPLYHSFYYDLDVWDDLYRAGFRDIDSPNCRGLTPLMSCALRWEFQRDHLAWLVDKGASMLKRLPFSDTTIAHRVSSRFADHLLSAIISDKSFSKIPHRTQVSLEWAKKRKGSIVLIPSVQDCCVCACCHGGCTTLSVALRSCNRRFEDYVSRGNLRGEYFWVLNSLIDLTETTTERDHSIIRFLTFEALGLRHTCCVEIDNRLVNHDFHAMNPEEVQNLQDEDKHRYKQLDQLVGKFDTWFDELELPIVEFLSGPWHSHMVEVLSTRDSYDEEHVRQTRDLGIFLEPVDFDEVPQFVYYLGHQVEELESEVAV